MSCIQMSLKLLRCTLVVIVLQVLIGCLSTDEVIKVSEAIVNQVNHGLIQALTGGLVVENCLHNVDEIAFIEEDHVNLKSGGVFGFEMDLNDHSSPG